MATFTMVDDDGLTRSHDLDEEIIGNLVDQTSKRVGWNQLGTPVNFGKQQIGNQVKSIHENSGIEFKSGFLMFELPGVQQKWEGQAIYKRFRLDLQNIEHGWANFSIQTNSANSVTVAKCMMQVGKSFGQGQLHHALKMSAAQKKACELNG